MFVQNLEVMEQKGSLERSRGVFDEERYYGQLLGHFIPARNQLVSRGFLNTKHGIDQARETRPGVRVVCTRSKNYVPENRANIYLYQL